MLILRSTRLPLRRPLPVHVPRPPPLPTLALNILGIEMFLQSVLGDDRHGEGEESGPPSELDLFVSMN